MTAQCKHMALASLQECLLTQTSDTPCVTTTWGTHTSAKAAVCIQTALKAGVRM